MVLKRCALVMVVVLSFGAAYAGVPQEDDESVWRAFLAWYKSTPLAGNPLTGYAAALKGDGAPDVEVRRRMGLLARLLTERSDWVEPYFDKAFARPLTGEPERDGFSAVPSALLVQAIAGVRPGSALDAGMGQGRNAVYLARQGWRVTGFDLSAEAVTAARANAGAAGVRIDAARASYADFDFGTGKWDLIVLAFAWAPVTDPAFVSTLGRSLRPGGLIVFEHFIDDPAHPRPRVMHALLPGQLRTLFAGFAVLRYEEVEDVGDWGGPGHQLVRMVAAKR